MNAFPEWLTTNGALRLLFAQMDKYWPDEGRDQRLSLARVAITKFLANNAYVLPANIPMHVDRYSGPSAPSSCYEYSALPLTKEDVALLNQELHYRGFALVVPEGLPPHVMGTIVPVARLDEAALRDLMRQAEWVVEELNKRRGAAP